VSTLPDALLFVTPGCAHCATVLRGLDALAQQHLIGNVTVVDASEQPERAAALGVRSAPWLQLGPFTLTGAHSIAELQQWAEWAQGEAGTAHYIEHLLRQGEFKHARAFVAADAARLAIVLGMLADTSLGIDVRLGVSALLERYARHERLQALLPKLAEMARHADHRVRADACHLLGLTGSAAARAPLKARLEDGSEEVREIAREALQRLEDKA
jgi:hypothetical protein